MDIQGLQLLDSCAYTNVFDGATRRFRRLPREARVGLDAVRWKEELRVGGHRVAAPRPRHPLRPFGGWSQVDGAA